MTTAIQRDSFIIYRSFIEIIRDLDGNQAKEFIIAISDYALDGVEPTLEGILNTLWKPVKPQLDANRKRYENGKKGGAPKGSRNNPNGRRGKSDSPEELTKNNPELTEPTSKVNLCQRPTIEQVRAYVASSGLTVDADKFFYYYDSRGWQYGNTPIANWTSLIHSWALRDKSQQNTSSPNGLGVGEYFDSNGNRTYGSGEVIVPPKAPLRPSTAHWWSEDSNRWENNV